MTGAHGRGPEVHVFNTMVILAVCEVTYLVYKCVLVVLHVHSHKIMYICIHVIVVVHKAGRYGKTNKLSH